MAEEETRQPDQEARPDLGRRDSNLQQSGDDEVDYGDEAIPDPEPKPKSNRETSQQGTKRKAEDDTQDTRTDDPRPIDPGALPAIRLSELHWWTTEEDLREICAKAEVEGELVEVAFGEHKINGKSKGEAYLEFYSEQAATAIKRAVDAAGLDDAENGIRKSPFVAHFTRVGNPYYTPPSGGAKKEESREGAYNTGPVNRGGYRGRGRGRGGFDSNRGGPHGNWGMSGGFMGGGYGQNPMMAGFGNMGMGGYGNMARGGGGMMNMMGVGGRGNFMSMGGNLMGGRGGGNWNNNAGNPHAYNQYQGGGPGNKRMRTE